MCRTNRLIFSKREPQNNRVVLSHYFLFSGVAGNNRLLFISIFFIESGNGIKKNTKKEIP